ncbi:hypothetical protein Gobs01_02592 [Geodermatophilus obscurus DSM 43160]
MSLTSQAHGTGTSVSANTGVTSQHTSLVPGGSLEAGIPAPGTHDRSVVSDLRAVAPSTISDPATLATQGAMSGSEGDTDPTRGPTTAPRSSDLPPRTGYSPAVATASASSISVVTSAGDQLLALRSLVTALTHAGRQVCQAPDDGVDRSRPPVGIAGGSTGGRGSPHAADHVVAVGAIDVPLTSPVGAPPLPAPPAAPVPVGPVTSASVTGTASGGGQHHHSWDDLAVLDEGLAASVALMAAARVAAGVAGHVLGAATDPGSRPD